MGFEPRIPAAPSLLKGMLPAGSETAESRSPNLISSPPLKDRATSAGSRSESFFNSAAGIDIGGALPSRSSFKRTWGTRRFQGLLRFVAVRRKISSRGPKLRMKSGLHTAVALERTDAPSLNAVILRSKPSSCHCCNAADISQRFHSG